MLIQKAKHFSLNDATFDGKIKGVTKIELTDAKTGKRKVIESENTFMAGNLAVMAGGTGTSMYGLYGLMQNAVSSSILGGWTPAQVAEVFMRRTVGGILLFEDAIPDNSRYMNAGNKMTANSFYGCSNSGTPVELGSYNASESSLGNNSMVFVYDWSTSQGNGDISSVCLSSERGGFYGYGNASGSQKVYNGSYNEMAWGSGQNQVNLNVNSNTTFIRNDIAYSWTWDTSTRIMTLNKYRYANANIISIFNGRLIETKTYDLSEFLTSNENNLNSITVAWDGYDTCLAFFGPSSYGNQIATNATKKYALFDLTDDSMTTGTFTNNTSYKLFIQYPYLDKETGNIVCQAGSSSYAKGFGEVNLTTGALVKMYHYDEDATEATYSCTKMTTDGLWLVKKSTSPSMVYIYDNSNDTMYPKNDAYASGSSLTSEPERYVLDRRTHQLKNLYGWSSNTYTFYNPMFLSTINNLDSTVTKNNTQTMKVTYTLTEA